MSRGFFQSTLLNILALAAVFFLAVSIGKLRPQKTIIDARLQNLEGKITETEKANSDLARLLDYFKSRAYLEREAKLKLNVRRPDENVVFIYEDEKESAMNNENSQGFSGLEGLTNFEKWLKYLFGN
ncbi:MAG: Uncharacterized protein G01um101444_226 [Parcubacteria group bacterium Gr01-1014_44]|nr:MAG: Uncharacterized protein G01um101444_226 [Parcubacteria group bacterium Gr01-1014_44]